jgi:hypothetical protein
MKIASFVTLGMSYSVTQVGQPIYLVTGEVT